MARVHFNASIIGDLRRLVMQHNQGTLPGGRTTKLEELKKVYSQGYKRAKGPNPGATAMAKVQGFLGTLAKAEDDFDESKVRRDGDGRFADKPYAPAIHQARQRREPEYRAKTTDVIPDRRGEAIGAVVRDAGSVAAGTALTLSLLRRGRNGAAGSSARWVAGHVGALTAKVPTAIIAHTSLRAASKAANATLRAAAKASKGRIRERSLPDGPA